MSWSFIGLMLCVRPLDVPLGELATAAVVREPHHEAVLVDDVHRTARVFVVGARADGDGDIALDGDGRVRGVVGALLVAARGVLVLPLAEPRLHHCAATGDGLVVRVVAVLDVLGEERRDPVAVVRLPGLYVLVEPAGDVCSVHPILLVVASAARGEAVCPTACAAARSRTGSAS